VAANPYTTNLELQLDPRTIVGLSDGDAVTTGPDSSAAGNDVTQATAGRRPIYKTSRGSREHNRFGHEYTSRTHRIARIDAGETGARVQWLMYNHTKLVAY
jgi:hypothetical protein